MLAIKDGRIVCPVCGFKTGYAVLPESEASNLPIFCKRCKWSHTVNITQDTEKLYCYATICTVITTATVAAQ
jgi:transcription elongation factor Elf1